jgi:hypothetical protein
MSVTPSQIRADANTVVFLSLLKVMTFALGLDRLLFLVHALASVDASADGDRFPKKQCGRAIMFSRLISRSRNVILAAAAMAEKAGEPDC